MELTDYIQYVVALAFVLALIGILFWALKKFRSSSMGTGPGGRRLDVVEGAVIDSKRRLVLVRRDNVEHLLLIGPAHDVVVEKVIQNAATRRTAQSEPKAAPKRSSSEKPATQPAETKKDSGLNWKLSTKEHVEPAEPKKKTPAKTQTRTAQIRPGEEK